MQCSAAAFWGTQGGRSLPGGHPQKTAERARINLCPGKPRHRSLYSKKLRMCCQFFWRRTVILRDEGKVGHGPKKERPGTEREYTWTGTFVQHRGVDPRQTQTKGRKSEPFEGYGEKYTPSRAIRREPGGTCPPDRRHRTWSLKAVKRRDRRVGSYGRSGSPR